MKKKVIILFLIGVFIISLLPIIEAAEDRNIGGTFSNAFDFVNDILNAQVKLFHIGPERWHRKETVPLGILAAGFLMIYAVMWAVTGRIPLFNAEGVRNARIAFSVGFAIITILASPVIEMISGFVGTLGPFAALAFFVVGMVTIAGVFTLARWRVAGAWGKGETAEDIRRREEERREGREEIKVDELTEVGRKIDLAQTGLATDLRNKEVSSQRKLEALASAVKELDEVQKEIEVFKGRGLNVDNLFKRYDRLVISIKNGLANTINHLIQERKEIIKEHQHYQMGLLWFVANDPRVPEDIRTKMSPWGLAKDEFADNNNWSHQIYVREARRMIGEYVTTENDVLLKREVPHPVGMGSYAMDSHNVQRYITSEGYVQNEGDIGVSPSAPYSISYGSIVPPKKECANLLVPVCVSSSHIAFGSIRMEPVFMILGQSAAIAACIAIDQKCKIQEVPYQDLRIKLLKEGQILEMPSLKKVE